MRNNNRFVRRLVGALSFVAVPTMARAQVQPSGVGVVAAPSARVDSTKMNGRQRPPVRVLDSTDTRSHRTLITGGILGGVLGGLGAAAYALNVSASNCVTIDPPCRSGSKTGRVVGSTLLGVAVGGAVGAWFGHVFRSIHH